MTSAEDPEGWANTGRRSARGRAIRSAAKLGDDDDADDSPGAGKENDDDGGARRSGRARKSTRAAAAAPAAAAAEEEEEEEEEEDLTFVRRSSRAAKPVARLSPEWTRGGSDDDDDGAKDEDEPDTDADEYVEEEEDDDTDEDLEDEDDEDDDEVFPTRYSRRERTTIERYSPKRLGGGLDHSRRRSPSLRRTRRGGNGGGSNGRRGGNGGGSNGRRGGGSGGDRSRRSRRDDFDDSPPRRSNTHKWMDDTDEDDSDGGVGIPGGFTSLAGGIFGGGKAPDPSYPLAAGGGAMTGGGAGGEKEAAGAEITPLTVDPSLTFDAVGGLSHYVHSLKEMVFLPLLYPEVFARFKMSPPRGVLLYGAPGTGKTLLARALAASCSRAGAEVAFFMRKGADVLSKWVGESERQLRMLFAEAQKRQPAIIFFDEIDGLAPVRSSKTDQIHNSIVATLLALMDGLDSRGRVVVLGATNRVDAIDGALRRPGRFDRELAFPLPNASARCDILKIHTRAWEKPPPAQLLEQLANRCVGYCGADLKALCTEAAVHALRRRYPQIYESDDKLVIDPGQVVPSRVDFRYAMEAITPASHRAAQAHARPLGPLRSPLLGPALREAVDHARRAFPPAAMAAAAHMEGADAGGPGGPIVGARPGQVFDLDDLDDDDDDAELLEELNGGGGAMTTTNAEKTKTKTDVDGVVSAASEAAASATAALEFINCPLARQPRMLLCGPPGCGQVPLGAALLHELEAFPVHAVGLPSLLADGGRSQEEALVGAVVEARRAAPAVLFLPHLRLWWDSASPTLRATLRTLMEDVPSDLPLLLLATCDCAWDELDAEAAGLFSADQRVDLSPPSDDAKRAYFTPIATAALKGARASDARATGAENGKKKKKAKRAPEVLQKAPPAGAVSEGGGDGSGGVGGGVGEDGDKATAAMIAEEDHALRQQRMFLRDLVTRLLYKKQWADFSVPASEEDLPGFSKQVKDPMDLSTLLYRVDSGAYLTVDAFLKDVHLIVSGQKIYWGLGADANEEESGGGVDLEGRRFVSRAHALEDTVQELVGQLDPSLVQRCATIARHRATRAGASGSALPVMPGEADRGERRSRRGGFGEGAHGGGGVGGGEGGGGGGGGVGGGEGGEGGAAGDKRSREVFSMPGYVPDPEALARELRAKRQREEVAAKEAAALAEAEAEAARRAEAAVAEAALKAAEEAADAAKTTADAAQAVADAANANADMDADMATENQSGDVATPMAMSDAELDTACAAVASKLLAKTSNFAAAEVEATATGLGQAVKAAAATARRGDALRATLDAMKTFAESASN